MSAPDPEQLLAVADEAARAAGRLLLERFGEAAGDVHAKSTPTDPVSEADLAAERAIRALLAQRRPGDPVLGEEGGESGGAPGGERSAEALRWVVDPLDGTVNYLFGVPQWAVSVACEDGAGTVAGVVHDPCRGETFSATRRGAARLGDRPISGSARSELATALVATGFGYDARVRAAQAEAVGRVLPRVRDIRRFGSAALDLAWTACGRYDAYYERGARPWDVAAGALLCARAGLEVRRLSPGDVLPAGLVAAAPALADPLVELVGP